MWSQAEHARVSLEARNSIADELNIEKRELVNQLIRQITSPRYSSTERWTKEQINEF